MGSKTILEKTKYGNILAKKKGESMSDFAKRQEKEFRKHTAKSKIKQMLRN